MVIIKLQSEEIDMSKPRIKVSNVSLYALSVALRYAMIHKWPSKLDDWNETQGERLQALASEVDRRKQAPKLGIIVRRFEYVED